MALRPCPCPPPGSPQDVQERWFAAQIELAEELQLPLFLHCRDAGQRFAEILRWALEAGGAAAGAGCGTAEVALLFWEERVSPRAHASSCGRRTGCAPIPAAAPPDAPQGTPPQRARCGALLHRQPGRASALPGAGPAHRWARCGLGWAAAVAMVERQQQQRCFATGMHLRCLATGMFCCPAPAQAAAAPSLPCLQASLAGCAMTDQAAVPRSWRLCCRSFRVRQRGVAGLMRAQLGGVQPLMRCPF